MNNSNQIAGWQFHHREQLKYRTTGSPLIRISFFTYPNYRQEVQIKIPPANCKQKFKGHNSFFIHNRRVGSRGVINLERIINIQPVEFNINRETSWGEISAIPSEMKKKYSQSSYYWPINTRSIQKMIAEKWFSDENLLSWINNVSKAISNTITNRENQEKRLGAHSAVTKGVGDCDEFTDLFITLARARGIPTRRITGFHLSEQGKSVIPHAWAEFWSPQVDWIPIDLALGRLGTHTINYVIWKVEEFNPELVDYQVQIKHSASVQHHWIRPTPMVKCIESTDY